MHIDCNKVFELFPDNIVEPYGVNCNSTWAVPLDVMSVPHQFAPPLQRKAAKEGVIVNAASEEDCGETPVIPSKAKWENPA